jgi:hypothetical protein
MRQWIKVARNRNGGAVFLDERLKPSGSIHHYLEYPHALAIFANDRLRLANPGTWPDPYERAWHHALFDKQGPLHKSSAYVLCWNKSHSEEPAWRMAGFQRANPIVRIRCRIGDLVAAAGQLIEQRPGYFFIGKVAYERELKLDSRTRTVAPAAAKEIKPTAANLLLKKRHAFRFENEVRSVWLDREPQNSGLFLPIDAKSTVRQLVCSPHAHPEQITRIHDEFNERFGVNVITNIRV